MEAPAPAPGIANATASSDHPETPSSSTVAVAVGGEQQQNRNRNRNRNPRHVLVAQIEDAHGVSDVNHVAWCTLSPALAAAKLRALEGGEDDPDQEEQESAGTGGGRGRGRGGEEEEDPRWKKTKDMFASAGDDGVVKVWVVDDPVE